MARACLLWVVTARMVVAECLPFASGAGLLGLWAEVGRNALTLGALRNAVKA